MIGIIYLIQPAELVGTNRFKIGISKSNTLKRVKTGYKKGSRYLIIMEVRNPLKLENIIKTKFKNKYKLIAGNEYFEGKELEITKDFCKLFFEYNIILNKNPILIKFQNNLKYELKKAISKKEEKKKKEKQELIKQRKKIKKKEKQLIKLRKKMKKQLIKQRKFQNNLKYELKKASIKKEEKKKKRN